MLVVEEVHSGYGESLACQGVSLHLELGQIWALLGRNGMGKTSLMRTIMRLGSPALRSGSIRMGSDVLNDSGPTAAARSGLGYVPQGRRIFGSLTVDENLRIVAKRGRNGEMRWTPERVFHTFPRLAVRRKIRARTLSGGEQQMLAIGRALVTNPTVLLLDEPSEGLAPLIVRDVLDVVRGFKGGEMAVLLAEQNHFIVGAVATHVAIMDRGSIVRAGPAKSVLGDQALLERHLSV